MLLAASSAAAQNAVPRVLAVQWPDDDMTSASTSSPSYRLADDTHLPVLVPKRFAHFQSLRFVGEALSYTATVHSDRGSMSITGTRVAFDAPGESVGGELAEPVAEIGEQTVGIGFLRYGVAYRIDIECLRKTDSRCKTADYVTKLLNDLELVGGSVEPAEQTGQPAFDMDDMTAASAGEGPPPDFARPPGELVAGSGSGVAVATVFAPGILFPVEKGKAFLNSQVYGIGGLNGPKVKNSRGWGDPRNYQYPWRDNFCENRGYATPMCPSGHGHQGQDIRPTTSKDQTYWAVAVEDSKITKIGSYMVVLTGKSGTEYRYLHLEMKKLKIKLGDPVKRGARIGLISNDFGKTDTTVHLHFEMRQNIAGKGLRHVPPYSSLVAAYNP